MLYAESALRTDVSQRTKKSTVTSMKRPPRSFPECNSVNFPLEYGHLGVATSTTQVAFVVGQEGLQYYHRDRSCGAQWVLVELNPALIGEVDSVEEEEFVEAMIISHSPICICLWQ